MLNNTCVYMYIIFFSISVNNCYMYVQVQIAPWERGRATDLLAEELILVLIVYAVRIILRQLADVIVCRI